jgi:hypothetical protein
LYTIMRAGGFMPLSTATITGRQHRLMQHNGHDFAVTGQPAADYAFGVVLDGCGSRYPQDARAQFTQPAQSEVGAKLIGRYAAEWLRTNLTVASEQSLDLALDDLFDSILQFVAGLVDAVPFTSEKRRRQFVATHLMATIVGFAVTPFEANFFWSGDGYLCQDGQVIFLDSQNQPDYLTLHFFQGRPSRFKRQPIERPAQLSWLAVATDGWTADLLAAVSPDWSGLELQRWVNVQARNHQRFDDDGAIAIWHNPDSGSQAAANEGQI